MKTQSVFSFALQLIEDGITDYDNLIKNKDMLIRFLTNAIENNNFRFVCENNINELLEKAHHHAQLFSDDCAPFDPVNEYGIRAMGEI